MKVMTIGTPIWSNGFGCITWVSNGVAGVALLAGGEPKVLGYVPVEVAQSWAKLWLATCQEDGRIEEIRGTMDVEKEG